MFRRMMDEAGEGGEAGGGTSGESGLKFESSDSDDWRAALPEDIRSNPLIQEVKDVATLAKQAIDHQAYQGNSIRIPGPDAAPEAVKEFQDKLIERVPGMYHMPSEEDAEARQALYRKLGQPESPEGYEFTQVEGLDPDEEMEAAFRNWSHELGLSKSQAKDLHQKFNEVGAERLAAESAELAKGHAGLKAEWGAAYDDKMGKVGAMLEQTGATQEIRDAFTGGKIGAESLKWMASIADGLFGNGRVSPSPNDQAGGVMVPAEAQAQIAEVMANPAYWDQSHTDHARLVSRMVELQKLANPNASTTLERAGFGALSIDE